MSVTCMKSCPYQALHPEQRPVPRCKFTAPGHAEHACSGCAQQPFQRLNAAAERARLDTRCALVCDLCDGSPTPCDLATGHVARGVYQTCRCRAHVATEIDEFTFLAKRAARRARTTPQPAVPGQESPMTPEAPESPAAPPAKAPRAKRTRRPPSQAATPEPVPAPAAAGPSVLISLADLHECLTNTRRIFRGQEIEELANSIGDIGVIQPLVVRRAGDMFEIVCGAKRYRAALRTRLSSVPCIVRELTDEQVLVLQLAENRHRSDVHPLEEAEGYGRLRDIYHRSVEEIAAETAAPMSTVKQRLRFLGLTEAAKDAFYAGTLTAGVALLVAAIPDAEAQDKALVAVTKPRYTGAPPLTLTEARSIIRRMHWQNLADAPWDLADATLDPQAGACSVCPYRTGHQPDLFEGVDQDGDECTKVSCFATKKARWGMRRLEEAARDGVKVIEGKAAADMFWPSGDLKNDPRYDTADGYPIGVQHGHETWKAALGTTMPQPAALVRSPVSGEIVELYDLKDLKHAAKGLGIAAKNVASPPKESKSGKAERLKREARAKARGAAQVLVALDVANRITETESYRGAVIGVLARTATDPTDYSGLMLSLPACGVADTLSTHPTFAPSKKRKRGESALDALHRAAAEWGVWEFLAYLAVCHGVDQAENGVDDAFFCGEIASACGLKLSDYLPDEDDEDEAAPAKGGARRAGGKPAAREEE